MIRAGYTGITDLFIDAVARIGSTQWEQTGLGEWTVRELVAHNCRATFSLVEGSIEQPAERIDVQSPADFWRDIRTPAENATIAAQGRETAADLGGDPLAPSGTSRIGCARASKPRPMTPSSPPGPAACA